MKKLFLMLFSALSLTVMAQQKKVAVYVTGSETIDEATKQIVGSELVAAFVTNNEYNAVERTSDFLQELNQEQSYQRSGNVDDQQISDMGKQFGVDQVCVANITPFRDAYYINARLINVETATVQAAAREISTLNTLNEFVKACEQLASKLAGREAQAKAEEIDSKEYSLVTSGDPYMTPIEIDNTGTYTKAVFKYITATPNRIIVSLSNYAQDDKTGMQYKFIGASGIIADQWTNVDAGIHTFTVSCEKMPEDLEEVTIYYTNDRYWKLRLTPYGRRNYYRFEDRTEELYNQAVKEQQEKAARAAKAQEEKARQQQELQKSISQFGNAIASAINPQYYLKVTNNRAHTRIVYVDGQKIGEVSGLSVKTFVVSTNLYRKIEFVQKNYLISPKRETFTNKRQPQNGQTVEIVNNPL